MAQHFLASPLARALPDDDMQFLCMNEGLAYAYFMLARWGSLIKQVCPKCGVVDKHCPRPEHKQWRCNSCRHDFSLKSGSIFQGSRLSYGTLLKAMWTWSTSSKGTSALAMTRTLGVGYEAAFLLLHRFRWAMFSRSMGHRLKGEVEVDVVWVFKHVRKFNDRSSATRAVILEEKQGAIAARLMAQNAELTSADARRQANAKYPSLRKFRNPKEASLLALGERGEDGRVRRLVGVLIPSETYEHVAPVVDRFVHPDSHLFTDGAAAYKKLPFRHTAVDHANIYSEGDGKHSNGVESAFARWRRTERGVYHRMNARTVEWYFAETAWREEQRRADPVQRFTDFVSCVLAVGPCWPLKKYGYEQRDRETKPRHIKLNTAPLPSVPELDRMNKMKLLRPEQVEEVTSLRNELKCQPTFAQTPTLPRIQSWDRRRKHQSGGSVLPLAWPSGLPQLVWGSSAIVLR